jgi:GNAT superfamily N-acetyltransferase
LSVVIRLFAQDARTEDYGAFARLFPELRVPDPTPTAEQFETRIRPHAFLLWEGHRPVAYAFWHRLAEVARVSHVVVDPADRGRGVGGALMRELSARARAAGCTVWELNVKPDNAPAIRLYTRYGMLAVARSAAVQIAWRDVARLPAEGGVEAFPVAPGDDAGAEAAMSLPRGQIAALRAEGRVLIGLRRDEATVAFAAFDPGFPGARPFVAPGAGAARALLEAMRGHARDERPFVRIVVDEGAVLEACEKIGGERVLEMLRMAGPIAF